MQIQDANIKVLQSEFIQSAQRIQDCFAPHCTEIAILGRSNVGKSSLINLLLNHRLAKSSSTPGKTKLINFFRTTWEVSTQDSKDSQQNKSLTIPLVIIDFPGFGYAKVSKDTRRVWDKNLSDFIQKRQSIKLFCHLIDSRHTNLAIDTEIRNFLNQIIQNRPDCKLLSIYTKDDKLTKSEYHKLKAQQKLTISTFKKTPQSVQNLYRSILQESLDCKSLD